MSVSMPIMNPLKFYAPATVPDYTTYYPLPDNTLPRSKYQEGIYAQKNWYKVFLVNKAIDLQFRVSGLSDENITVTLPDATTSELTPTDISPAGWTGDTVNKYTFTPTQTGVHTMVFNEESQTSDTFIVVSATKFRKKLVYIQYRNTDNDFGMVFYDNGSLSFTGKTYFTGILEISSGYDVSAYQTDRGTLSKTQATPVRNYVLTLTDVHRTYKENIDHIFACDYLNINGVEFQNQEAPEISIKDKLDLMDITINLTMSSNDYFVKNL